ncbi:phosphohydrolase [Bacillus canaveralius]|uniref:Phosphohydrolase n=1 Tax=Bacillus canaveralius TaxID=1403243 RepID=A0A2N5GGN9_9BACI|nr:MULTISPECIES: HD domain-containing protein [Bacillus]PLR79913.1 phosphohydrolase [Bacillus canaveralius]PLR82400.1 phosphohydrolase [Bacillus sp. V33-4]PLR95998.1 phosphohydrolase [Bacillus canaveralius]RSK51634.1 HD domain-containing protein [Bacillus canaveralius]
MRDVTLTNIFQHRIAQKYLTRSGLAHAIAVSYHAFHLAKEQGEDIDIAAKAGFLHDIGHYTWYKNGKWDYNLYKQNDIHAIKGAERAHKLLIRLGENPIKAKNIALAILFHTDSFLPGGEVVRSPIQTIIKLADEKDEEPGGAHHYRNIDLDRAMRSLQRLDEMIDSSISDESAG